MATKKRQASGKRHARKPDPTPDEPAQAPIGRPTKYKAEYAAVARALCKRGATDHDLAQEFGVATSTIWRWSAAHEEFCSALRVEKAEFDNRIERALAQRACGYSYEAVKVMQHNGVPVYAKYTEHVPPDPGAAKLWLCNRKPEEWRDKVELGGRGGGAIPVEISDENAMDLARRMILIMSLASRPTGAQKVDA